MIDIAKCRLCGNTEFAEIIDLGEQYLTGVFPKSHEGADVPCGPLKLVICSSATGCGLVQLANSFNPTEMYGDNYGYRSGLNQSMVRHLSFRVDQLRAKVADISNPVIVDIGSNDGTTLAHWSDDCTRIGVDPTAERFGHYYPKDSIRVATFFNAEAVLVASHGRLANVVTAFSMMYDLEDPVSFIADVARILSPNGVFAFEQSYLPLMLQRFAFDTICHEHLEYYAMRQIDWILNSAGLEAVDVELNDINGGSFAVIAAHAGSQTISNRVFELREEERHFWEASGEHFAAFCEGTRASLEALRRFIALERSSGRTVAALGASTKGNVLLQAAGLGPSEIAEIGDVNHDKHGCLTPGTGIPIVPEEEVLKKGYDYYIVLPWHFREFFLTSQSFRGRNLVFPLPKFEIVRAT